MPGLSVTAAKPPATIPTSESQSAAAGFEPKHLLAAIEHQPVKDELRANTEEAIARGVFGAPTFFVGDRMFFGQDRLDFVEEALGA